MMEPLIYMPVKDAIDIAEKAIRRLCTWQVPFTVWNDRSSDISTTRLHELSDELGFHLIDVADLTEHPSPNYHMLLCRAQAEALAANKDLVIVESDVLVQPDTLQHLLDANGNTSCGMVAAVTHDEQGNINFPYIYARKLDISTPQQETTKRLSFCCTLITNAFLRAFDFSLLNSEKDWFDVTISKASRQYGFKNLLLLDAPVTHLPHASRPWKQLKYTHPLKYYWLKLIHGRDKI